MNDVLKSLLGLCSTNGGYFKSEKQAKFLLSRFEGNTFICNASFTFGEYEGRTSRNTRNVSYVVVADNEGIVSVTKGDKVSFQRSISKESAELIAARKTIVREAIAIVYAADSEYVARVKALQNKVMTKGLKWTRKHESLLDCVFSEGSSVYSRAISFIVM